MFFDMFKPEDFYKNYNPDHFLINQELFKLNLGSPEKSHLIKSKFPWIADDSIQYSLKMQVRLNTLLCINSLFELVYNLLPDGSDYIPDKELVLRMNKEQQFTSLDLTYWIKGGVSKLEALNHTITYSDGRIGDVISHLFYFGRRNEGKVAESTAYIMLILKELAGEISNTEELNAFKHGMRGVISSNFFKIKDKENQKDLLNFDFSNSHSYYTFHKKGQCFSMNFKSLDLERCYTHTSFATLLIRNIILPRKHLFFKNHPEEVTSYFFTKEHVDLIAKSSLGLKSMTFSNCKKEVK